jgi:oligoendopeptidase F
MACMHACKEKAFVHIRATGLPEQKGEFRLKTGVPVKNEKELKTFLDNVENRLEEIEVEKGETLWRKYIREPSGDLNEIERKRSEIILDEEYLATVTKWRPKTRDTHLKTRLRVLEKLLLREHVEAKPDVFGLRNKINEDHIAFQPVVLGKQMQRSDVYEILRKNADKAKRKAAWESFSKLSHKIEEDVGQLIKLRNEHIRESGYQTYDVYVLAQNMIDKAELLKLYDELCDLSEPFLSSVLDDIKDDLKIEELQPWDISYVIDQFVKPPDAHFPRDRILQKTKDLARSFGFVPEELPILIKQTDIPFGGLCFGIRIPTDMRILSNPRDGHRFYRTLFHEYGHALHGCFIDQGSFALKDEVGCFCEGMACIMEQFASDADWLRENTSVPETEIRRFVKANKISRLLRLRNLVALSTFEFQACDNPDQELNRLWSKTRSKYLFVQENETPQWASQSIFTTHPIYFQNYIIADLIAAQTIAHLKASHRTLLNNPRVSEFLISNYYAPGASVDWQDKIEKATGRKLSAKPLIQQLTSAHSE